MRLYYGEQYIT